MVTSLSEIEAARRAPGEGRAARTGLAQAARTRRDDRGALGGASGRPARSRGANSSRSERTISRSTPWRWTARDPGRLGALPAAASRDPAHDPMVVDAGRAAGPARRGLRRARGRSARRRRPGRARRHGPLGDARGDPGREGPYLRALDVGAGAAHSPLRALEAAGGRRGRDASSEETHENRSRSPGAAKMIFAENERYAGKILYLEAGPRLSLQYHEKKGRDDLRSGGRGRTSRWRKTGRCAT